MTTLSSDSLQSAAGSGPRPPDPGPTRRMAEGGGWWAQALSVLGKDLRSEIRSAAAAMAIGMFALVTLVLVSYGIGQAALQEEVQASLLWTVLFFASSVGLARTFVKEEETKTAIALRMSARPSVVFGGKLAFNCLLMVVLAALLVPLFLILMTVEVQSPPVLLGMVAMGVVGLAGGSTIVAAIIAKAQVKGPLFGALAFPILVPLLLLLVRGTALALEGAAWSDVSTYLLGLIGFTGAMITASFLLFDAVWES